MAARGCAAGTGAVPWSRAAGVASARLDGVGLDAALSWKLTAVMEQTTTEVKFYHLLSFSISLPLSFLSFGQIVPSTLLLLVQFPSKQKKKKSASLFLPFIALCCPSPAETPEESCWTLLYWIRICVCVCLFILCECLSAFPLITAKCLICIPPARIKGTQRKFPKSKYSKPCIIDFCFFFAYGCQVSGGRWEVCVSRPCSCVFLAEERNISAMAGSLLITIIPSPYRSHLQLFYKIKKVVVRM